MNVLARLAGASVRVVDIAVDADLSDLPGVGDHKVRRGSGDIAVGPALTRDEAEQAVARGHRRSPTRRSTPAPTC